MGKVSGIVFVALVFAVAGAKVSAAESLTDPVPPGKLVYPYKDLPGVTAPRPAVDDPYKCHTVTGRTYSYDWRYDHSFPALVYVCEQNGVVSSSSRPPNRPYWQYDDRGH